MFQSKKIRCLLFVCLFVFGCEVRLTDVGEHGDSQTAALHTVFLDFGPGTYTDGPVAFAPENVSSSVGFFDWTAKRGIIREPGIIASGLVGEQFPFLIKKELEAIFSELHSGELVFTLDRPTDNRPYNTVVFDTVHRYSSAEEKDWSFDVFGISSSDCGDVNANDVVFVFVRKIINYYLAKPPEGVDVRIGSLVPFFALIAAHELGHAFGLVHVFGEALMYQGVDYILGRAAQNDGRIESALVGWADAPVDPFFSKNIDPIEGCFDPIYQDGEIEIEINGKIFTQPTYRQNAFMTLKHLLSEPAKNLVNLESPERCGSTALLESTCHDDDPFSVFVCIAPYNTGQDSESALPAEPMGSAKWRSIPCPTGHRCVKSFDIDSYSCEQACKLPSGQFVALGESVALQGIPDAVHICAYPDAERDPAKTWRDQFVKSSVQ
ncbi:MAG: hypothetical protein IPJ88_17815 [Myxococcales bacterium]|nr:MAG: hypothetical protein IPJ88_17815 [Myxococcales bacterium]